MPASPSVRTDVRYVLTDVGRNDLLYAKHCECSQLWISDGVYRCDQCGTIYGVVFGFTVTPRRLKTRTH